MRFNPFSNAFSKRQAPLSGEASLDAGVEPDDQPEDEQGPEPTDDPMTALRDIKRFGFAKRPDGTLIRRADLEEATGKTIDETPLADQASDHQAVGAMSSEDSINGQAAVMHQSGTRKSSFRLAHRLHPSSHQEQGQSLTEAPHHEALSASPAPQAAEQEAAEPDGPLRRTVHTERLRAEMGEAGQAAGFPDTSPADTDGGWIAKPKQPDIGDGVRPHRDSMMASAASAAMDPDGICGVTTTQARHNQATTNEDPLVADNPQEETVDDDFDDIAVTIGRVVSTRGSVVWGALFDDIGGQASKAARMGGLVSMRGPESRVFGIVNSLEREQKAGASQAERTVFEIQVLGEIADDRKGFQRGVSSYPPLDATITTVTLRDIATIYARPSASNVHIGQLRHNPKIPAFVLTDSLLGKHFAVLGTTGAGKSCAVTVILQSILNQHPLGHIVLLDPHNEYGPAFGDRAELLNPSNLQLPYWLLNFEEIAHVLLGESSQESRDVQSALLKDAIVHAKQTFAGDGDGDSQITVDTPLPYRLSDLVTKLKDGMGMLNKADGASSYLGLINRVENLRSDKRYAFMFQSLAVRDNMEQILAQLLRIPTKGKPLTIIDISGLPSEIVDVVVSVLFRLTFELAVWSERGKAPPVLLVCEEAHRYVPEEAGVGFAPTRRVIARIAKEGRKYGVTLCLVSQRPSELATNSLAQCNTVFALRLSNEHDQAFVGKALSENSRWLVDSLPSLNTQEAVVVGDGVTVPVHIRFNDLDPKHRPASHDPSFSESWRHETDDAFLNQAIDRWRRQTR